MRSFDHRLPDSISQADLLALVNSSMRILRCTASGALPCRSRSPEAVLDAIDPAKMSTASIRVTPAASDCRRRCTPLGRISGQEYPSLAGMEAVVIGRSNIVGKPVTQLLLAENATVTVTHSRTRDLPAVCRRADLLVAAIGKPEMVRGDWIKPGATVIDVGINRVAGANGKSRIVGDVAFAEASAVAGAITPVPGGVGPMTIACLMANTVRAACAIAGLPAPALQP